MCEFNLNVYKSTLGKPLIVILQIPKEQETEENVSWEDQTRINKFSNLAALNSELEERLKEKSVCKNYLFLRWRKNIWMI